MVVVAAWCFGRRRRRKFVCSQQTSTNSNPKTTTSYSPTTTNSKHDITQQFSGERQHCNYEYLDVAHKIKTITNTKMHEMHLDIVIITDVPIFTGAPKHSLEITEPQFGTGNARSSKEGHETSAKASESLPFECTTGDQIQWGHEMKMKAPQVHMSLLCCSDEPGTCGV